jgi:hypothetical protein
MDTGGGGGVCRPCERRSSKKMQRGSGRDLEVSFLDVKK